MSFNYKYFLLFLLMFGVETGIALFVTDGIVRPFGGDVLVVILLYFLVKSFFRLPVMLAGTFVLAFAFIVEGLQAVHFLERIGLQDNPLAATIAGTSFSWIDMGCYVLGIILVVFAEDIRKSFRAKL